MDILKVIRQHGEIALSWVKTHAMRCVTSLPSQDPLEVPDLIDIHLHLSLVPKTKMALGLESRR